MNQYRLTKGRDNPLMHALIALIVLFQLFPLLIMVINSLRTDGEIKTMPIGLPTTPMFSNYAHAWRVGNYLTAYQNSLVICFFTVCVVVTLAALAGYALAKMRIPGRSFFLGYFTLGVSIPGFLIIVPNYQAFSRLNLANSHLAMVIIYSALFLSFQILMIRSYLIGIPRELEEAGRIDGCNELNVMWRITFPVAKPIMFTSALLVFVLSWNEFLWSNTFLSSNQMRTVPSRFYMFVGEHTANLAMVYTAGAISIAPVVVMYVCLQKRFIEGMTSGSVKG